jgi:hypothetical protein
MSSSQIFKTSPSLLKLFMFLDNICEKKNNKYTFEKVAFKKAQLGNSVSVFFESIKPHYFKSKLFYITRTINYKNCMTVIRQICKYHHIAFTSTMKYDKSKYEIIYSIFIPEQLINV